MAWTVESLSTTVDAELAALPDDTRARLVRIAELIEDVGLPDVGPPHVRHVRGPLLDPKIYAQMQEPQGGRYSGLGITIQTIDGEVTAVSLFEGSPAYKQGVRSGDITAKVDGDSAKGWTPDQASRRMRVPKGTLVHISVRRRGYDRIEGRKDT